MRAAVEKLDGIAGVEVSTTNKKATIQCKPGSKATVEQIRSAIAGAGFQPRDAEAKLVGKVIARDGKLALQVAGSDAVYTLTGETSALTAMVGKTATVNARVPEGNDKPLQVVSAR